MFSFCNSRNVRLGANSRDSVYECLNSRLCSNYCQWKSFWSHFVKDKSMKRIYFISTALLKFLTSIFSFFLMGNVTFCLRKSLKDSPKQSDVSNTSIEIFVRKNKKLKSGTDIEYIGYKLKNNSDSEGFKCSKFDPTDETIIFITGLFPIDSETEDLKKGNSNQSLP